MTRITIEQDGRTVVAAHAGGVLTITVSPAGDIDPDELVSAAQDLMATFGPAPGSPATEAYDAALRERVEAAYDATCNRILVDRACCAVPPIMAPAGPYPPPILSGC